jgi:hypothetical protein
MIKNMVYKNYYIKYINTKLTTYIRMNLLKILLITTFIYIVNSQHVSPRQVIHEYLYNHECKDKLLNIIILSIFKGKHNNFNSINEIISTHMPQYKQKNILKCYDILIEKYYNDNRPNKLQ